MWHFGKKSVREGETKAVQETKKALSKVEPTEPLSARKKAGHFWTFEHKLYMYVLVFVCKLVLCTSKE